MAAGSVKRSTSCTLTINNDVLSRDTQHHRIAFSTIQVYFLVMNITVSGFNVIPATMKTLFCLTTLCRCTANTVIPEQIFPGPSAISRARNWREPFGKIQRKK